MRCLNKLIGRVGPVIHRRNDAIVDGNSRRPNKENFTSIFIHCGRGSLSIPLLLSLQRERSDMRLILVAAVASVLALAPAAALATDDGTSQLIDHVNAYRISQGLKPLTPEARLTAAAQSHAKAMATSDCFAHVCPNGTGLSDRLARAGYSYRVAAENIAAGMEKPKDVVNSWIKSGGHRRNMLLSEATEVGAGHYLLEQDGGKVRYRHYWTMTFGTRP